ncbi:MAG TPA: hypothetical protein VIZ59_09060 [Rubrobacteraceae bacterium]
MRRTSGGSCVEHRKVPWCAHHAPADSFPQPLATSGVKTQAKTLERYLGEPFDLVITVCDDANEACPVFPGARERLHWSFPDPSRAEGERRLAAFRQVRDQIRSRIEDELIDAAD